MELLLASLLFLWGNTASTQTDITFEQIVQATSETRQAIIAEHNEPGSPPLQKSDPQAGTAPAIKGIYVTAHTTGVQRMQDLYKLIEETELNSMVIDVKDDFGYITFQTDNPHINDMETTKKIIPDPVKLMNDLEERNIYPIARIVVFKDSVFAEKHPDMSFINPDGTVWKNGRKESFVNPYKQEIWDYNIEVAKEAAKLGFKEIQFDYVRFPEGFDKRADILKYDKDERSRIDVVADFVKYAREQLAEYDIRISVDIFGYAASVPAAEGIGQDFVKISQSVDVISPMIYPSHYSTGWFGVNVPDAQPYTTIYGATADTIEKLEPLGALKPIIRPWIQDFTATWVPGHIKYGKFEVEEQIRALQDHGIDEFLLWNASNRYTHQVDYILK